ncbi:MAG: helix-turn-helix transcriptional regulator, partial [Deltaproteobacteria bacterium]
MSDNNKTKIEFEESSGNIFADLGIEYADELFARAQLGFHVTNILKEKGLKLQEIAKLLGMAQPDVSHLMNGHFSRFTTDKLLDFFRRLDKKVTIRACSHKRGEPYQEIGLAPMSSKPQSEMMEYKSSIEAYFKEHPPANIKEAMVKI